MARKSKSPGSAVLEQMALEYETKAQELRLAPASE
jgi:hypothetical protein